MALIKCPECSKEISDVANVCPNCGFPIKADVKNKQKAKPIKNTNIAKVAIATILLVVVCGIGMLMYNRYKTAQELNAKEEKYQEAINLISNRDMKEARKILEDLTGYKDSDALLKETQKSAYDLLTDEERDFFNKLVIAAEWDRDYMIREYHSDAKLAGLLHIDDDKLFEITAIQKKHLNHDIVPDSRLSDGEGWVFHVYFPERKGLVNEENIALGNGQVGNNYDFDGYNEWMLFGNTNQDQLENDNTYDLDLINEAIVDKWY